MKINDLSPANFMIPDVDEYTWLFPDFLYDLCSWDEQSIFSDKTNYTTK